MEAKALNLVVLRTIGAEKSASGNTIQGQHPFTSKKSTKSITQDVVERSVTVCGFSVNVHDTPGLSDTVMCEDEILQIYGKVFQKCESGPCVFLLVIKADRFTEEERKTVEKIEELLEEKRLEKTWIIFTNGKQLVKENKTIKEFIDDSEPLKTFVQKYNQRYHVVNKSEEHNVAHNKMLLAKMIQTNLELKASEGGRLLRRIPAIENSASNEQHTAASLSSRRIVLLGKTGVGKSASGNTILKQKVFISKMRMNSVTSVCSEAHSTVSGRSVSVVDTPGFFDTEMKHEELSKEIARSVYISSPGPHAFLILFRVDDRFTEHEQQIPQIIEMMFGQEVLKYSIILFTRGDQLEDDETVEELIKEKSALRHLVQQCGGRFHVFNNKDQNNREQVDDLLQKIDTMIEQNGGGHYSNQMFEDAQKFRREKEERRQREEEKRKQQVEKQIQEELKRTLKLEVQHESEFDKFYMHYEHRFSFSAFVMSKLGSMSFGACIGGATGAIAGIPAGPAGIAAGAMLGAAAGAAAGAAMGAAFSL
ncbi:GTPase IMAP family member 8-like [Megalobrama amblycephala]|uniref:GTPase IMAP family member 8-like n=1 Tax=Megalobrama amblycephala TaxID=75352 RepID=UPI0020143473|nr:GTPase IMAP family member 8-like [Megalobrama amblycephala]XP_048039372.1 GTPase IMAP family member 8-like [Megalobrama amblycephala]XP_048039373.1 GTPase IMAP family member 8-like [Megalobrama amblycephala]